MDQYKTVCFDLDGTVYRGDEPIPQAVELIGRLQGKGISPYFITNNSSMTTERLLEKLSLLGIESDAKHVMTSAVAAAAYCKEHFGESDIMMIGEEGLREALWSAGHRIVDQDPDIVVVGIDRSITYDKLARACLAIRAGAKFIATNLDKAFPAERGLVPGNGSFVQLLEAASGKSAVSVGKPEPHMLHFIQERACAKKDEMILVGDNYDTDIMAGIRFGIHTAYVEGGVTPAELIREAEEKPTYQFADLSLWE